MNNLGYPKEILDFEYDHKVGLDDCHYLIYFMCSDRHFYFKYHVAGRSVGQEA